MPELLAFFQKAFYFMILISIVVIVHEWGHFIVARLCGVGVEAFSLFFGKPLLKWKRGRTEWRLSAIPLGGYVKMIGQVDLQPDAKDQVPEELRPLSFAHKPLWARSAIVAAGPLMNVVLTFVIFSAIFFVGYPQTTSLIGHVDRGGVADEAGLRAGDRVVSVDGKEIWRWDELSETVRKNPERRLVLTVERGDERLQLPVTPRLGRQKNIFQFEVDAGLIGISPDGFLPIIGVTGPGTPAAAAGFKTGDLISGIDGEPVRDFADFERKLARADGHTIIMVERGGLSRRAEERNPETFEATIALTDERPTPESLGFERADLYVLETVPDSPAALAGMVAGDRIVSANGKAVASWDEFTAIVRDAPGEAVAVTVRRGGETVDLTVTPELIEETDVMGERIKYGRIGLYPWISYSAPEIRDEKHMNPLVAIQRGLELTGRWVVLTLQGFYYMVSGDVSVKSLGGPIMIADLAGKSAEGGAYSFMMFVAIISLNLAILNLLPIPVLDGGHLLLFAIEGVIRRPVPELGLKIATNVGLFLVGCLMVAAVYNDIARVFPGITTLFGILD